MERSSDIHTFRAYLVWSTGVVAYVVAVLQRTSLGVAGVDATERLQIAPVSLSLLVVVQVAIYAAMQIPAGLLLDRYGARVLIAAGAAAMASGQLLLALTERLSFAVLARLCCGIGDSLTLIAVLSLVAHWFPSSRAAFLSQVTAMIGQLGQVLSAVPLSWLLRNQGWTHTFSTAAAIGIVVSILSITVIRNNPLPHASDSKNGEFVAGIGERVRAVARNPGTRLGFFAHMGTVFPLTTFVLLWGVPYLKQYHRVSNIGISAVLTVSVATSIVAGVVIGIVSARRPDQRINLVLCIIALNVTVWTIVTVLPGKAPLWLLFGLVMVMSLGAPGSLIGFDFARTLNPLKSLGTAQGIVNTGGYVATLLATLGVGVLLSMGRPPGYSDGSFRVAWLIQYPLWIIAIYGIWRAHRQMKKHHPEPRMPEVGLCTSAINAERGHDSK